MPDYANHITWKLILLCTLPLAFPKAASAKETIDHDSGLWAPITLKAPIYEKWQASIEYQPRYQREPERNLTESIVRLGAGYEFNKKLSVFGGAYWSSHFNPELDWENRLWEQATYTCQLGRIALQNRLRLEQIEREQYQGGFSRIRHQFRVTCPLPMRKNWYLIASEEPFFNLNSPGKGPPKGFNQNRLFLGIGRKVNSCTRWETGFLHQYKNNRGKPDLINGVLLTQLSFDLTAIKANKSKQTKLASSNTIQVASKRQANP